MLPTIALGIGVVVAGLGIGAFLSALQNRGPSSTTTAATTASSLPAVTPVARATRGPVAIATMVAHPTPTPMPTPTPAPTVTAAATAIPAATAAATVRPTASPRASLAQAATPTPPAAATPHPTETPAPRATLPPPTVHPTIRPTPRPTAPPTSPLATAPTTVARVAQAGPGTPAEATVRRYLAALIAGNENAAYAALGASPGDPGAQLSEEAFIDRGTRISSMRTTSANQNGATVEVEMTSSRGSYFATYHVTSGPNGPVIDQHDYIKV